MWYNILNIILNVHALFEATGDLTTLERKCCMPHYNRVCPVCQKEFPITHLKHKLQACSKTCAGVMRSIPLKDGFWSKVDKSGGPDACWPWTGCINAWGYGK